MEKVRTKKGKRCHFVSERRDGRVYLLCGKEYPAERLYRASEEVRICRHCNRLHNEAMAAEAEAEATEEETTEPEQGTEGDE